MPVCGRGHGNDPAGWANAVEEARPQTQRFTVLTGPGHRGRGSYEELFQAVQITQSAGKKSHPPVSRCSGLEDDLGSSVRKTAETGLQDAGTV